MRILHTADWHLGRSLEQYSRLEEQAAFLDELQQICDREAVDLLLICGDVFDTYNPPAAAENLFYDALERLAGQGRRAVVAIAGNHDNPDRLAAAAPLAYRHGVILLGYPSSDVGLLRQRNHGWPDSVEDAGPGYLKIRPAGAGCAATLITLPYPSEARLAALAERQTDESRVQLNYSAKIGQLLGRLAEAHFSAGTVNLIAAHLFMQGGWTSDSERTLQMGAAMLVDPSVLPPATQYAALGHLHRPQGVAGSPVPARYAGSPLAYSFSEADYAKSVCLV
ncbi:MAG TPA: exonuclease sbcCD subunit D, partial [Clostridiales bacterium]|nr:exonuclease sbcCD subunit D [Clostridiales bacterium]